MSNIAGKLISVLFMFAVLFDKDGAQYGLLFATPPDPAMMFAHFVGNILWVFGLLYLLMGVVLFVIAFSPPFLEKVMTELEESKPKSWDELVNKRWYETSMVTFALVLATFSVGSSFWFFGLTWLFFLAGAGAYKFELRDAVKLIKAKKAAEELEGK